MSPTCSRCGVELIIGDAWAERLKKLHWNICHACYNKYKRQYYRKYHPLKDKPAPECRNCGVGLVVGENWYLSSFRRHQYICKACNSAKCTEWARNNVEKTRANSTKTNRKNGHKPMGENKACGVWLGVHVAERVLSHVFADVEQMPFGHSGYDFICNRGKKIDVKSSCLQRANRWAFAINRNKVADGFLCIAFDNRDDLNPLHIWLVPGYIVNKAVCVSLQPNTVSKWSQYELPIGKVVACCEALR